MGEGEELGPVREGRENFEGSRERTGFVPREQDADPGRGRTVWTLDTKIPRRGICSHSLGIHLDDLGVQPDPRIQRPIHARIHARLIRYRPDPRHTRDTARRMTRFVQFTKDEVGEGTGFVLVGKGREEVGRVPVAVGVGGIIEIGDPAAAEGGQGFIVFRVDLLRYRHGLIS